MRARTVSLILSLAGVILATWVVMGQTRRVDDLTLRNAGRTGEEWLTYGLTPGETRYSPLKQIDAANVSRLGLAFSYEVGPGGGNQEATPLFWNGTLFSITNWSVVYAIDARTGKEKWRWDPEVNQAAVRPKICCGVVHRGLALYQGKIIAPIIDGRLQALDAETGKPIWEARVAYPQDNYTVTMAPRIAKGKVVVGVSGAEYPVRGFFSAFDANTGALAWKFYTIPGDPSKPFEQEAMKKAAETWSGEWWKLGGGGTVWDGFAYDPESNLVYVGTGNGGPWPEELRGSKGKDNLYACSILAVNIDTGILKWYYQNTPGDSWDYDSVQGFILADMTINGRTRKTIMQANKNGFYYVLDRVTGAFISAQPFAVVTWAKGIDQETGKPIVNPEAHYDNGGGTVTVQPGAGGGHNWSPMSYNPNTGLVYIPTTTTSSGTYTVDPNFTYVPGRSNTGLLRGNRGGGAAGAPATPPPTPKTLPAIGPTPPSEGPRGMLVAWDPITQKERWRTPGGGGIGGGTVTTASNIVFQVINDGRLMAYTADKGEKLLEIQTGLRGGMGPPITYMLDGKQYVALNGGTGQAGGGGGGGGGGGARGAEPLPPDLAGAAAQAAAAQRGNAPAPPATPPAANAPGPVRPKLLIFTLDAKGTLPVAN